jgi:predicted ATPase
MVQHKRYVLTGSPGSGKTTLLQALKSEQITCFEEVFRTLFLQAKDRGVNSPFQDEPLDLSEQIIKGRLADFNSDAVTEIHFYDRGIHDAIAYLDGIQVEVPKHFIEIGQSHIYDKVFILPPWQEIFANDQERIENFDETEAIHNELVKTYTAYGMPPIIVPKLSVEKRVSFLNDHL